MIKESIIEYIYLGKLYIYIYMSNDTNWYKCIRSDYLNNNNLSIDNRYDIKYVDWLTYKPGSNDVKCGVTEYKNVTYLGHDEETMLKFKVSNHHLRKNEKEFENERVFVYEPSSTGGKRKTNKNKNKIRKRKSKTMKNRK